MLFDPQMQRFYDKAFDLLMLLTRTYPILSTRDPLTQEIIDPAAPLIFFSNGDAYLKSSVKKFYRQRNSYDAHGQYLGLDGWQLSLREVLSLQQQGVRFIEKPSIAEKIGKIFGTTLGLLILLGLYVGAVVILPLPALAAALASGVVSTICVMRPFLPTQVNKTIAFITGTILAISVMALLCVTFPPVAALLVTAGLITSGPAAAAVAYFTTMLLPCVPALVTAATFIGVMVKRISIPDVTLAWARVPSQAIVALTEGAFSASTAAQPYVFPTTGSYRLNETEDKRTERLSMTR